MFCRPRIIPTLLIDDGDLIKTVRFGKRTYLGDPVNAVKIFNRKNIDEMAILDIGAAGRRAEPDYELLKDMASEAFMPLSYGGGIRYLCQIHDILALGYEKVVVNSALVEKPTLLSQAAERFGSQSVVASIDAKKERGEYVCYIGDGRERTGLSPVLLARRAEQLGAGEILLNSMDRDGMMNGYDLALVRAVADSVHIPVIALGGAGGIHDLKSVLQEGHAHAAAGGSMFVFYGRRRAVLITAPDEETLLAEGIYKI